MTTINQIQIFDRKAVRRHRERAALGFAEHRVLFDTTAAMLIERLDDVRRVFPAILDLGAHDGQLAQRLKQERQAFVVAADLSAKLLGAYDGVKIAVDEELLPFAANSFDLIISNLSLHWVNDLPGALTQIKQALRPGGLFLATLIGGDSLPELRSCLMDAELALSGGLSPRVSPTISLLTASALLQRAGFDLPVVDHEIVQLTYPTMNSLLRDLRGMGETNAHSQRLKHLSRRDLFATAAVLYDTRFKSNAQLTASFDIIFLHGWKTG